jgi:succinate dehydrogenase / fumarate reductase flavoprotein subunit
MQGLADGYFVLPYTIGNYLASTKLEKIDASNPEIRNAVASVEKTISKLMSLNGKRTVDSFHRELGRLVWEYCGMARNAGGLDYACSKIAELREEFWQNVTVPGGADDYNQSLERAGRVADFFELAELMCIDARHRDESCGGHFREEYQTPEGEALRDDERYSYVAAWEFRGVATPPELHKEPLEFHYVHPTQRSYK